MTVWRTIDGRTWTEMGPPGFVEASGAPAKSFYLYPTLDGPLVAWSYELPAKAWETTDGLNWKAADLPPPPSTSGSYESAPLRIGTGWFATTGDKGGSFGGDARWIKAGDSWFPRTEMQLSGWPIGTSGVGNTTFFTSDETMWVMNLDPTE